MQFSSIKPIDRALSGALSQSGPGSHGNEGVLFILQSFIITKTSPSDSLVSYPRHLFGGGEVSYPSAEMQSVYSAAPADWATDLCMFVHYSNIVKISH